MHVGAVVSEPSACPAALSLDQVVSRSTPSATADQAPHEEWHLWWRPLRSAGSSCGSAPDQEERDHQGGPRARTS
eukprot:6088040-Pyramimonas_sp.AAC.1